jgi:hypothetical protein
MPRNQFVGASMLRSEKREAPKVAPGPLLRRRQCLRTEGLSPPCQSSKRSKLSPDLSSVPRSANTARHVCADFIPLIWGIELGKRLVRQWCREKLSSMIEPTEQELQMIEIIREQKSNFQLVIGSQDGAWGSGAFSALVQIRCCKRGAAEVFPMPGMIWRQRTSKPFMVSTCWAP